jgi:hypothetical protein
MPMSAEREALALKQLRGMGKQRQPSPPRASTATKPEAIARQQERIAKAKLDNRAQRYRVAALECGHSYEIGGGDKQFERLFCGKCGGWQKVASIKRR